MAYSQPSAETLLTATASPVPNLRLGCITDDEGEQEPHPEQAPDDTCCRALPCQLRSGVLSLVVLQTPRATALEFGSPRESGFAAQE